MTHGIGGAASRLARLVRGGAARQGGTRFALVVQLDNPESLCASLGPALFDRMMDKLTLRLAEDLRLIPQTRTPGVAEIRGVLVDPQRVNLADLAPLRSPCGKNSPRFESGRPCLRSAARVLAA